VIPSVSALEENRQVLDAVHQTRGQKRGLSCELEVWVAREKLFEENEGLETCQGSPEAQVLSKAEREMTLVGMVAADIEAVAVASEALASLGVVGLSVDLTQPTLVPAICRGAALKEPAFRALRRALDHKDSAAVAAAGGKAARVLQRLLASAGGTDVALKAIAALDLPKEAAAERARLVEVARRVAKALPGLAITIDPIESRGFEYHTGVSFAFFARGVKSELGRGGRYRTGDGEGEDATGFTLYTDTILEAMPAHEAAPRLYLPAGSDAAAAALWRSQGYVTVAGLAPVKDAAAEARRLRCGYLLAGEKILGVK